jgi:hypothetical protein
MGMVSAWMGDYQCNKYVRVFTMTDHRTQNVSWLENISTWIQHLSHTSLQPNCGV